MAEIVIRSEQDAALVKFGDSYIFELVDLPNGAVRQIEALTEILDTENKLIDEINARLEKERIEAEKPVDDGTDGTDGGGETPVDPEGNEGTDSNDPTSGETSGNGGGSNNGNDNNGNGRGNSGNTPDRGNRSVGRPDDSRPDATDDLEDDRSFGEISERVNEVPETPNVTQPTSGGQGRSRVRGSVRRTRE